jgi:hypothetical protein
MICSGVCRLLLIADLLAESPTSSDPNIRSGLLSGGHARGLVALRSRGHSWTDQGFVHPLSRTLWTGDIFHVGSLFDSVHGGSMDEAIATYSSFLERDDWENAAQPLWDFTKAPDPAEEEFLVPRSTVERHYEELLAIRAGSV